MTVSKRGDVLRRALCYLLGRLKTKKSAVVGCPADFAFLAFVKAPGSNRIAGRRTCPDVGFRPQADIPRSRTNDRFRRRIQPVDATLWLNRSAGVWKPSVFLGLSFNCLATALSLA